MEVVAEYHEEKKAKKSISSECSITAEVLTYQWGQPLTEGFHTIMAKERRLLKPCTPDLFKENVEDADETAYRGNPTQFLFILFSIL